MFNHLSWEVIKDNNLQAEKELTGVFTVPYRDHISSEHATAEEKDIRKCRKTTSKNVASNKLILNGM